MNQSAQIILIPTPISGEYQDPLHPDAMDLLALADRDNQNFTLVFEDEKPARRRWLKWGLSRERVESFLYLNEHNVIEQSKALIEMLQKNSHHRVLMFSDAGLPSFCDPGHYLIDLAHGNQIVVSSTHFFNAPSLALALSGEFVQKGFRFYGFLDRNKDKKRDQLLEILTQEQGISVVMDTPYRLDKTLEEMSLISPDRIIFLALNLNKSDEKLLKGKVRDISAHEYGKHYEFVIVICEQKIRKLL